MNKFKVPKGEKKKFYKMANDLIKKIDKSIKEISYSTFYL